MHDFLITDYMETDRIICSHARIMHDDHHLGRQQTSYPWVRPLVIAQYCKTIKDLKWAVEADAKEATEASRRRVLGAWVVVVDNTWLTPHPTSIAKALV